MLLMFSAQAEEQLNPSQLKLMQATCYTCHHATGDQPSPIPPLEGLDEAQLRRRLYAYKADEVPATIMNRIAKALTDHEIDQLSAMISAAQP